FPVLDGREFAAGRPQVPSGGAPPPDVHAGFRPGLRLPVRVRLGWRMVHDRGGELVPSRTTVTGRLTLGRARMTVQPDGHLGFLAGRTPFAAVQLAEMGVSFGC